MQTRVRVFATAIGVLACLYAVPVHSEEPAQHIEASDIVGNDIKFTSSVASHADEAGLQVDSYRESERPVGGSGDVEVLERSLQIRIRKARVEDLYEFFKHVHTSGEPVRVEEVTFTTLTDGMSDGGSEVRASIGLVTFIPKTDDPDALSDEQLQQLRGADAWRVLAGAIQAIEGDLKSIRRINVDTDRRVFQLAGWVEGPKPVDTMTETLEGRDSIEAVDKKPIRVESEDRARFELEITLAGERAEEEKWSYTAGIWKRPDASEPTDESSSDANQENGTADEEDASGDSDSGLATGRVTVYSKPKGTIVVDGVWTEQQTPGTVKVESGRYDVRVEFDDGSSESKTVRVEDESRLKLFFRK